jgi:flagellar protein FliO/FliZ
LRKYLFLFTILLVVLQWPVTAQESEELLLLAPEETEDAELGDVPLISTWDFVRVLLVLGIVVGVIYLIFFLLRRGFKRRLPENEMIRVIGSRTLTGNRSIHLIELGRSLYLIGSADGGINLISEINDRETQDMIRLEQAQKENRPVLSFGNLLQGVMKPGQINQGPGSAGNKKTEPETDLSGSMRFMKKQRERLRKL